MNILKKICENKKKELEITKSKCSLDSLIKLLPEKKNKKFKKLIIESQKNHYNNIFLLNLIFFLPYQLQF